ncbi:MAG: hypothetical protein IKY42_06305, partial [Bacteroidaceae bacterium]|nr:hypothetical protein [Bacteroidaceae bacterium]
MHFYDFLRLFCLSYGISEQFSYKTLRLPRPGQHPPYKATTSIKRQLPNCGLANTMPPFFIYPTGTGWIKHENTKTQNCKNAKLQKRKI